MYNQAQREVLERERDSRREERGVVCVSVCEYLEVSKEGGKEMRHVAIKEIRS